MQKLLDKWYLSLILVPITLTYLTEYFSLLYLKTDWNLTIILTLTVATIILIFELIITNQKLNKISKLPKEQDITIIKKLLKTLNVKSFEYDICTNDSWNGYREKSIHNLIDYLHKVKLLAYRTTDAKLNNLLANFNFRLEEFIEYSSCHLYGHEAGFLIPFKYNDREKAREDAKKMNHLSMLAFKDFEFLILYLKEKKYI